MKRYIIIGLMAWTLPLYSQEAQTVRELVDAVRQETGQAVYCHPSLLDKQVTVEASGETTDEQLRKAVEKLGGQVTAWPGVGLFVLPEQQLITSLPPLFAQDTTRYESYAGMSRFRQGEKATSENKVYEVGGGEKQADGRALLSSRRGMRSWAPRSLSVPLGKPQRPTWTGVSSWHWLQANMSCKSQA